MKRETKEWLILSVLVMLFLLAGVIAFSQDSIKVKILKVRGHSVWMKTLERPRIKLFTYCKCPYKKNDIVWIKKHQTWN